MKQTKHVIFKVIFRLNLYDIIGTILTFAIILLAQLVDCEFCTQKKNGQKLLCFMFAKFS